MTTDEKELWERKGTGDLDARNELVVRYEKTALRLVGRWYNRFIIHVGLAFVWGSADPRSVQNRFCRRKTARSYGKFEAQLTARLSNCLGCIS